MRAAEFITEKKKRKRKLKGAAWGPGPFGGYGYASGYSGAVGGGEGGAVGEGWKDVAAAGALGTALALGGGNAKAQSYNEPQQQTQTVQVPSWQEQLKAAIKDGDIPNGEKIQIQRDGGWITKVVVDGKIYDIEHRIPKLGKNLRNAASQLRKAMGNESVEEDWRHWVAGLGAASALAGGGSAAYDAYKASQAAKEPTVNLRMKHEDLGTIDITVQKANQEAISINIGAHSVDGKAFFQQNSKDLVSHLTNAGLTVADMKVETSSQTAKNSGFDMNNSDSGRQGYGSEKNFGSEQNQRRHDSERRQDLWNTLYNKEAA